MAQGLTSTPQPFYLKSLPGMNNKVEPLELQEKWAQIAQNCRFEPEPGAVSKREPVSYFNPTSIGTDPIVGLYRYYKSDGTSTFVAASGNKIYVGSDTASTFTAIRTLTTTGKRCNFITYKDILIGSNGYDNLFCYDGSTDYITWELGSCKAEASTGTGITRTDISYQITIDSDAYVCGAVSNTIASVTNKNISLTNIPLGPVGTNDRKIYRKDSGSGGNYCYVATLSNNTTTTYTDSTSDVSGAAVMPSVTDDMPKGSELQINRERLFISRDPANSSRIYFANPYLPGFIQQTTNIDYLDVSPEDNDEIMGIPIILGVMLCFKKNTIRKLYVTGEQANWYSEDPFTYSGTPAAWSICKTPYGILYLGWDHWYTYDGAQTQPIIDEFDTFKMLSATYSDVVSFWDNTEFLATYTDIATGSQTHDRVMRYNFKRKALSYDTLSINCFAAKRGDSENGELYYGSSREGYVYKSVNEDIAYKLSNKAECNNGTGTDIYIGGTEGSPYIEIGSITSAVAIPADVCILWDSTDTNPGLGWTEITSFSNRFIKISATYGTLASGTGHTHTVAFTTDPTVAGASSVNNQQGGASPSHTHDFSGSSSSVVCEPRYIAYRIFYKNSSTTEYEFPVGAVVIYDQAETPDGWEAVDGIGYYIKLASTALGTAVDAKHGHTFTGTTGYVSAMAGNDGAGSNGADGNNRHTVTGLLFEEAVPGWELINVSLKFMKRVGETGTWDGSSKYVYALYQGTGTPSNGWSEVSATYEGRFLRTSAGLISLNAAVAGAHTHTFDEGETDPGTNGSGRDSGAALPTIPHMHTYQSGTSGSGSPADPDSVTFRLIRKILGKMKDYNGSWESATLTTGTWTSPAMQLSPETLRSIWWNESLIGADNILVYMRSGATQVDCLAMSWGTGFTNPNAQPLTVIPARAWIQYKIVFSAANTTLSNPKIYSASGYLVKFTYSKGAAQAEQSVEYIYDLGVRHLDMPMIDKIFQKVGIYHTGEGSYTLYWETEYASGSFVINLSALPLRWDSYFPSTAFGRQIKLKVYKNDLYSFKLKEIQGVCSPQPLII